jgi:hypothetical protein
MTATFADPFTRGVQPRASWAARRPARTANSKALKSTGRWTTETLTARLW